jgi:hypothetical protein
MSFSSNGTSSPCKIKVEGEIVGSKSTGFVCDLSALKEINKYCSLYLQYTLNKHHVLVPDFTFLWNTLCSFSGGSMLHM